MLPYWKCLGFVLYLVLYFNVLDCYEKWPEESMWAAFFKILPIMHLIFIVISTSTDDDEKNKSWHYRKYTLLGLFFSALGDIALVWNEYFILGVVFFIAAQACYTCAFGFHPFSGGPTLVSFVIIGIGVYMFTIDGLDRDVALGLDRDVALKAVILAYTMLIMSMWWRATVQLKMTPNVDNICAFVGAALFVISDLILVVDKWKGSFHKAPFWNMMFYYTAQLLIALSACNTVDWTPASADAKNR